MRSRRASSQARGYDAVIATPVGRVGVMVRDGALVDVAFLGKSAALHAPRTDMARRACRQIRSYFSNSRHSFHIPLKLSGTAFQQRVWRALRRIPAGRTLSYGKLARRLDTSARAVGNACRANPVPIVVPCHRVVASGYGDVQGSTSVAGSRKLRATIGGFMGKRSGSPLSLKYWLLEHERRK